MDLDTHSDDRTRRAASVLSMDDLEAAQALEGLRTGTLPKPVTRPILPQSRLYDITWDLVCDDAILSFAALLCGRKK